MLNHQAIFLIGNVGYIDLGIGNVGYIDLGIGNVGYIDLGISTKH